MRTVDIVARLESGMELDDAHKRFIISRWKSTPLVKDEKYGSLRCPTCNDVVQNGRHHYCSQCGQRITE